MKIQGISQSWLQIVIFLLFVSYGVQPIWSQNTWLNEKIERMGIAPHGLRAHLAVDYTVISEIKAVSRKRSYSAGELISVDVAMLNQSDAPIHFVNLDRFVSITLRNKQGKLIPIQSYGVPEFLPSATNYELVLPHAYSSARILYTIGCENSDRSFRFQSEEMFRNDAFINRGRGCFNIPTSGTFQIIAQIRNDYVLVRNTRFRTAVGEIESRPFEIEIKAE